MALGLLLLLGFLKRLLPEGCTTVGETARYFDGGIARVVDRCLREDLGARDLPPDRRILGLIDPRDVGPGARLADFAILCDACCGSAGSAP